MRRKGCRVMVGLVLLIMSGSANVQAIGAPASSYDCRGTDMWWGATLPRFAQGRHSLSELYVAFQPSMNTYAMQVVATTLRQYAEDQQRSSPPGAAKRLNTDLVRFFEDYAAVAQEAVNLRTGNMDPLSATGAKAHIARSVDELDRRSSDLHAGIGTFILQCQPVVVFVSGEGSGPIPVFPGDKGGAASAVACRFFRNYDHAEAFFHTAGPGDPYHLDANRNGHACDEPGIAFYGQD